MIASKEKIRTARGPARHAQFCAADKRALGKRNRPEAKPRAVGTGQTVNLKRDGFHGKITLARFAGVVEMTARLDVLQATAENREREWLGNITSRNSMRYG